MPFIAKWSTRMTRSLTIVAALAATVCIAATVALGSGTVGLSTGGSASAENQYASSLSPQCRYLRDKCAAEGEEFCTGYFNLCSTPRPPVNP